MPAGIGIVDEPGRPVDVAQEYENMMPFDSRSTRRRRRARETKPVGGTPKRSDRLAENAHRSAAAAEGPRRASRRMTDHPPRAFGHDAVKAGRHRANSSFSF